MHTGDDGRTVDKEEVVPQISKVAATSSEESEQEIWKKATPITEEKSR